MSKSIRKATEVAHILLDNTLKSRLLHVVKICSKNRIETNKMRDREKKSKNYRLSLRNVYVLR